jgi:hypothetical protein
VISKAFGRLPDNVLLPWLPRLITTLRDQAGELMPALVREAGRTFPGSLAAVDAWTPPWSGRPAPPKGAAAPVASGPVAELLMGHPATCDAVAALLGCEGEWRTPAAAGDDHREVRALLAEHAEPARAVAALLS